MRYNNRRFISLGAAVALIGIILSGPISFFLVHFFQPQPEWESTSTFIAHYHALQNLPYYAGLILIGGLLILFAAHYLNAELINGLDKLHILLSVMWCVIFSVMILFNYICQTTIVPNLIKHNNDETQHIIAFLTMANPSSLGWTIEMWGYGILGVACMLLSPFYKHYNKAIYNLLNTNGILSISGVVFTIYGSEWLLKTPGIIFYFTWNILMIVLLFLIYKTANNKF